MKLVKRDPTRGYIDTMLHVPKSLINVDGVKRALEFELPDRNTIGCLRLWEESEHHLVVPRAFWKPEELTFECVDCRPQFYERTGVVSKVHLDYKPGPGGILQPTGKTIQRDAIGALLLAMGGTLQLACGKGKAQPVDTPVLTPAGWRPIGGLRTGDLVIGASGKPVHVTGVYPQGKLRTYRVVMDDGTCTKCCNDHLWLTQTPSDRRKGIPGVVRTTREIQKTLTTKAGANHSIPRVGEIEFDGPPSLYDAWVLGVYLGDGHSAVYNGARRIQIDKGNRALHNKLLKALKRAGDAADLLPATARNKNLTTMVRFARDAKSPLWDALTRYGLVGVDSLHKFIPKPLLLAKVKDRWALLDGLLVTDGSITSCGRTYSTSSKQLAEDVTCLARSLGCRVHQERRQTYYTYKGEKKAGAPSVRLHITHPRWGNGRYTRQYIKQVSYAGTAECVCISVLAADSLYVTENFIVTHNTVVALHLAALMQVPVLIAVDNTHLLHQWMQEIERHLEVPGGVGLIQGSTKDWNKSVVMATYQTLANWADSMPEACRRKFGLSIWDEGHHVNAPTFSKSAPLFYGYRLALTATPDRTDGTQVICQHHMGDIIFKDVVQDHPPKIVFKWTGFKPDMEDPTTKAAILDTTGEVHLGKLAGYFGSNRTRMTTVVIPEVQRLTGMGHKVIVLSYSVDEVINLMTLWTAKDPNTPLYTDLPYPAPEEVGEALQPLQLSSAYVKKVTATLKEIRRNLALTKSLPQNKREAFTAREEKYQQMLDQYEVWKKTEKEYRRRQRAFLLELLGKKSDAGLFTEAVKPADRMRMLAERQVIFAIMKYGREGLDDKKLSAIVVCEPMSDKNVLQQVMGRPRDKHNSELVFLEDNVGPLIGQCMKLRRHLRDWPVDEGGPFKYLQVDHPSLSRRQGSTVGIRTPRTGG
jgi:hypothetical protein